MKNSPDSGGVFALRLEASPNPLPSNSRTTTISWDTGNGTLAQLWVSRKGGEETLFAVGASGTQEATWIDSGETYEFRLYAGSTRSKLLSRLEVNRSIQSAVDKARAAALR